MRAALAVLLAAGGGAAWPLTFGTVEGSARFGAALDVRVPITLDHRAEAMAPCVQVDLWYGRSLRDPSTVRSDVQIVGKTGGSVRVRSAAPIDHPVITLGVSTTCGLRTARQFVLVAQDLPADFRAAPQPDLLPATASVAATPPPPAEAAEPATAVPLIAAAAAAAVPLAQAPAATTTRPAPAPMRPARTTPPPVKAPATAPAVVAAPAPAPAAATPRPEAGERGPRLRLSDWPASATPAVTEADRAHARAVWRVLQTDADVLARETQQPQAAAVAAAAPVAAPVAAAPAPVAAVAPPPLRAAPGSRVAAGMDSVIGLLPFAMLAAVLVLASVVLALRLQRHRRARREAESLQSRHSGRDSVSSQVHSHSPTQAKPRRSRIDDDFVVALDIDLEASADAKATAPLAPVS